MSSHRVCIPTDRILNWFNNTNSINSYPSGRFNRESNMIDISNFCCCEIEDIGEIDANNQEDLEKRIFLEVDNDEQKFINIMTLLSSYYGDVSSDMINKWSR